MRTTFSLTVVVPVYNEAALLADALSALEAYLRGAAEDFEIVVVESGSTDGSAAIADGVAGSLGHVRVLHEGKRNGFGSALRLGFREARKDVVTMVTVDYPFDLRAIADGLKLMEQYDCVLSYRSQDNRTSAFRKFQSAVFNFLIRVCLGIRTRHVNSAFKMYKRSCIGALPLISDGWFIDSEIVYWMARLKIKTVEIPITLRNREKGSSSITLLTPFGILVEMIRFLLARRSRAGHGA